jgi:hypothetical protein
MATETRWDDQVRAFFEDFKRRFPSLVCDRVPPLNYAESMWWFAYPQDYGKPAWFGAGVSKREDEGLIGVAFACPIAWRSRFPEDQFRRWFDLSGIEGEFSYEEKGPRGREHEHDQVGVVRAANIRDRARWLDYQTWAARNLFRMKWVVDEVWPG